MIIGDAVRSWLSTLSRLAFFSLPFLSRHSDESVKKKFHKVQFFARSRKSPCLFQKGTERTRNHDLGYVYGPLHWTLTIGCNTSLYNTYTGLEHTIPDHPFIQHPSGPEIADSYDHSALPDHQRLRSTRRCWTMPTGGGRAVPHRCGSVLRISRFGGTGFSGLAR